MPLVLAHFFGAELAAAVAPLAQPSPFGLRVPVPAVHLEHHRPRRPVARGPREVPGQAGYGRRFTELAVGEYAGKMHDDLVDGVRWAVAAGIADPARVAIYGGSYGGCAALVGMTFTPDVFACGVSTVGRERPSRGLPRPVPGGTGGPRAPRRAP